MMKITLLIQLYLRQLYKVNSITDDEEIDAYRKKLGLALPKDITRLTEVHVFK